MAKNACDLEGYCVFPLIVNIEGEDESILWGIYSNAGAANEVGKRLIEVYAKPSMGCRRVTYFIRDYVVETF